MVRRHVLGRGCLRSHPGTRLAMQKHPDNAPAAKLLSPRRKTTRATNVAELAREQLAHFHLDPTSPAGAPLLRFAEKLYAAHGDLTELWDAAVRELPRLP